MSEELNVIFHASSSGRTDILQTVVDSIRGSTSTDIATLISTARAEDSATPLHIAAECGHPDVIRALLNAGAHLDVRASHGSMAGMRPYEACSSDQAREAFHVFFFEAIAMSDIEKISSLLKGGISTSVRDIHTQDTPLHWACSFGNYAVCDMLLNYDNELNVNCRNASEQTPLHLACKASSTSLVRLLLANGADMTAEDTEGNVPQNLVVPSNFRDTEDAVDMEELFRNPPPMKIKPTTVQSPSTQEYPAVSQPTSVSDTATTLRATRVSTRNKNRTHTNSVDSVDTAASSGKTLNRDTGSSTDGGFYDDYGSTVGSKTGQTDVEYPSSYADGCVDHTMSPILVLWPPPKTMSLRSSKPFLLSSSAIVTIAAPSTELDTVSTLVETLQGFNFQAEIASPSIGTSIQLNIDRNICPKTNGYQLIVDPRQIQILANDSIGLRYAVHAFVQLLQLHSELTAVTQSEYNTLVEKSNDSAINADSSIDSATSSNITVMKIPSVAISDFPDTDHRAVMWSHRSLATHKPQIMIEMIQMFSKLHLNSIMLTLDPLEVPKSEFLTDEYHTLISTTGRNDETFTHDDDDDDDDNNDGGDVHYSDSDDDSYTNNKKYRKRKEIREVSSFSKGLQTISDHCKKEQLNLIPTYVFTNLRQYISPNTLAKYSHSDSIILNFDYTQPGIAEELISSDGGSKNANQPQLNQPDQKVKQNRNRSRGGSSTSDIPGMDASDEDIDAGQDNDSSTFITTRIDVENALKQRVADIVAAVQAAGYRTVFLVCNSWVKNIANPLGIASRFGLNCVEKPASVMFTKHLFLKPFLCIKEVVRMLYTNALYVRESGSSFSCMPAFVDTDCFMPLILLKYHCFLHAGFAWNSSAVTDMLGEPADADANVLREVAYLILFSSASSISASLNNEANTDFSQRQSDAIGAILNMFTTSLMEVDSEKTEDSRSTRLPASAIHKNRHLARVDRVLYKLLSSRESISTLPAITKEEAAMCSRLYRRLFLQSKWTLNNRFTANTDSNSNELSPSRRQLLTEIDEFFMVVYLLHTLTRLLVGSYNGREANASGESDDAKGPANVNPHEYLSYASLISSISHGHNSDIANSFLGTLDVCVQVWKLRFETNCFLEDRFYEKIRKEANSQKMKKLLSKMKKITSGEYSNGTSGKPKTTENKSISLNRFFSGTKLRDNFYRKHRQGVPVTAIFNAGILSKLKDPQVVETSLLRLFGNSELV